MKLKSFILGLVLAAPLMANATEIPTVVSGMSVNKQYALKAFGTDLLLYKQGKIMLRCVYQGVTRGIDNNSDVYAMDFFECQGNKTLGVKTYENINDGGWVIVVEQRNGQPYVSFQQAFYLNDGVKK